MEARHGMRDVLSHHYLDLDAEIVFQVCGSHGGKVTTEERDLGRRQGDFPRRPHAGSACPRRRQNWALGQAPTKGAGAPGG